MRVLIWDRPEEPFDSGADADLTWSWRSYAQRTAVRSVPRYLEEHASRLRQKYLAFVHDLGERKVGARPVIEHFDLGDGFSLWWMTLLAEKSPLKSPGIYTCLRLLALEEMLLETQPDMLVLVSSDRALTEAVRRLCLNLRISFSSRLAAARGSGLSLRGLYDALPHVAQGLLSLRYLVKRWALRAVRGPEWFAGDSAVFVCSYFIHLEAAACAQGTFHSRHWENLPQILHAAGRRTNWMQLFLFSAAVPDVRTGSRWVRLFNRDAAQQGCHSFLDSYLSGRVLISALGNWLRLLRVAWRLRAVGEHFRPAGSAVWLWPVLRRDWGSSVTGTAAMSNCLWIALFEAALANLPRQPVGLYLYENQAWEKALLRAWRKYGHGRIIGVQHATVPFWHLYYFDDPRSRRSRAHGSMPLPDRFAVNGAAAWRAFAESGYPPEYLVETEAVRYLSLRKLSVCPRPRSGAPPVPGAPLRVLVLGDLIPASMRHLLCLLEGAMPQVSAQYQFTLKPHPGLAVDLEKYPGLRMDVIREALAGILGNYDIALAANCTSAAVEAYIAGLSVVIGLDAEGFNLSPLRGEPGVRFVSTAQELVAALQSAEATVEESGSGRKDFFFLDPDLPRWKRLLEAS